MKRVDFMEVTMGDVPHFAPAARSVSSTLTLMNMVLEKVVKFLERSGKSLGILCVWVGTMYSSTSAPLGHWSVCYTHTMCHM